MTKHTPEFTQPQLNFDEIGPNPTEFCLCGCGQKTPIAKSSCKSRGLVRGQPVRFVHGHSSRQPTPPIVVEPNPSGLCACGCGQPTPLAKRTSTRDGTVMGKPVSHIPGHGNRRPLKERFWKKVDKRGIDDCWLWDKPDKQTGYGRISVLGVQTGAHRVSWEMHNGPIPDGLEVCHNCPGGDNRACVNPMHLFLATHQQNMEDCKDKGRNFVNGEQRARGERNGIAKLTNSQVLEIRRRANEEWNDLAQEFGVSRGAIYRVVKRLNWRHI